MIAGDNYVHWAIFFYFPKDLYYQNQRWKKFMKQDTRNEVKNSWHRMGIDNNGDTKILSCLRLQSPGFSAPTPPPWTRTEQCSDKKQSWHSKKMPLVLEKTKSLALELKQQQQQQKYPNLRWDFSSTQKALDVCWH